jgi:hypothetical protein
MSHDLLKTYDDRYAAARARVAEALSKADERPSGRLLRWPENSLRTPSHEGNKDGD